MKNKKLLKAIAATMVCSAMGITAFSFAACGGNGQGGEGGGEGGGETQHYHTYSTGDNWGYDGTNHWRYATCEHTDLIAYKALHDWDGEECTVCGAVKKLIKPTLLEEDDPAPDVDEDGKISVKYEFTAGDYEAMTYGEDLKAGMFTVCKGTTIRTRSRYELKDDNGNTIKSGFELKKSIQLSSSSSKVQIKAPAAGKLTLWVQDGSNKNEYQQITLRKPNGDTQEINYPGKKYSASLQLVEINLADEGVYEITRPGGTSDIFYMAFEAKVVDSPVESIEVSAAGTVDYYVGQTFGIAGLSVNAVHETTGRIALLQTGRLEVDYTAFNTNKAGTYEIGVSYVKGGKTFTTSYNVNVYSYDEVELGTDTVIKGANTSADNQTYINHSLRQLYFKNETLSTDGLSVTLKGKNGENKGSFLLGKTDYTVSEVDMTTTGKKAVTVTYTTAGITKQETFDIYVIEKDADLATATSVNAVVDKSFANEVVGVKNGDGAYQFQTIHQVLEFLENSGVQAGATKTVSVAAGTYWEKLEIRVPNLTLIGAGRDTTKIEYDSLYGAKDAGGYEHVTDSTATMNVREAAVNFTMKNITVSNYYNSVESYYGAPSTDQRALAILIQADKVTIDNCGLLGYQDTIELFSGRQYIVNSYISGTTDFIFGTNNTTYFKDCEIHTIDNGKTDGGYVTAFKGNNKDANDAITYGAIFDGCDFTADDGVLKAGDTVTDKDGNTSTAASGNTAIGRPWGAYANVAVINSTLGAHISTAASTGASKNERYVSMSGVNPTDSTVKFREYNNTGAGAITTKVAGMEFLSETEAANYSNYQIIFGTANGYSSVWEPISSDAQTHTVTVKNDEGTPLFELKVEDGGTFTLAKLSEKLAETSYAKYDIEGVYTNEGCTDPYDMSAAVTANGEIYVKLVEGPISANDEWSFKGAPPEQGVDNIRKLNITANNGSFVGNYNGDTYSGWAKLTGDATLSLNLKADTKVIVSSYDDGLAFTMDGATIPVEVSFANQIYTVEVREAGTLVISRKGNGYIGYITVAVDAGLSDTKSDVKIYSGDEVVNSFQVWDGSLILKANIDAIKNEITPPAGQAFIGYFSDAEYKTEFDFSTPVTEETKIYIGWGAANPYFDEDTTITFGSSGNYSNYVGTKLTVVEGEIRGHAADDCEIPEGTSIAIQVKKGTTVKVSAYPGYTYYKVKIDEDYYKADGETEDATIIVGAEWTYVATKNCTITFVGQRKPDTSSNYFYSIAIVAPGYDIGEQIDFTKYNETGNTVEGDSVKWGKVELDATKGKVQYDSSNAAINCNVGTVIKFKVASGVTADNIVVVDYKGNDIPVADGIWDITVDGGVASVECKLSGGGDVNYRNYIKYIKIVAAE